MAQQQVAKATKGAVKAKATARPQKVAPRPEPQKKAPPAAKAAEPPKASAKPAEPVAVKVGDLFIKGDKQYRVDAITGDNLVIVNPKERTPTRFPSTKAKLLGSGYVHQPGSGSLAEVTKPASKPADEPKPKAKAKAKATEAEKPAAKPADKPEPKPAKRPIDPVAMPVPEFKARLLVTVGVTAPNGRDVNFLKGRTGSIWHAHGELLFEADGPNAEMFPFVVSPTEIELMSELPAKK